MPVTIGLDTSLTKSRKKFVAEILESLGITPQLAKQVIETRSTTIGEPAKIGDFGDLLGKIINTKLQLEGYQGELVVTHDYPDKADNLSNEVITYSVDERIPGIFGQTSRPFSGTEVRQHKPRLREIRDDPENPGYKVFVLGWHFENAVSLRCWGLSHKIVEARADWLEKTLLEYEWYFLLNGILQMRYEGRKKDNQEIINQKKIPFRELAYYVRTESVIPIHEKTLEQITIRLNVGI